jgi:hypothetical protein
LFKLSLGHRYLKNRHSQVYNETNIFLFRVHIKVIGYYKIGLVRIFVVNITFLLISQIILTPFGVGFYVSYF